MALISLFLHWPTDCNRHCEVSPCNLPRPKDTKAHVEEAGMTAYLFKLKVTRHLCFKNSKNLRPLDILACNLANKPSFQNPPKVFLPNAA